MPGLRATATSEAESLAKYDPDRIRAMVVEPGADEFARGVLEMLKPRQACSACGQSKRLLGWYRLFAKMAKLVDAPQSLVIAIWNELGVRDESEARSLIGMARTAGGVDADTLDEWCRARMVERGWTVIAPGKDASANGGTNGSL